MLKVGITGGMGTGKSTVLQILADKGYPTISADKVVHSLLEKGQVVYKKVIDFFGKCVLNEEGDIVRSKLAARIFADDTARLKLEAITHPHTLQRIKAEIAAISSSANKFPAIFVEVPLLFEAGWEKHFDLIWVIAAGEKISAKRLAICRGFRSTEIEKRQNKQMPLAEKKLKADVVIDNDGSLQNLSREVEKKLHDLGLTFNRL